MLALIVATAMTACHKDHDHFAMDNQSFVTRASSANMFEIAAGNLALHNSSNIEVKAFGNHMVTDHSKVGTEMAAMAQQKGWTIPTNLQTQDQANLGALSVTFPKIS